jgi:acetylglutamate kinase
VTLTVLKLGGELIEGASELGRTADAVAALAQSSRLIVVHGGGKAIDAELARRGIEPVKRDGIRVTDEATLDAVVAVLAGAANTTLVAALVARGVRAVGLTGADDALGMSERVTGMETVSGAVVDPGLVGRPIGSKSALITDLCAAGYVPVIASIGVASAGPDGSAGLQACDGTLLNVNADVMAAHVAAAAAADRLLVAGSTPGVLDGSGKPIGALDRAALAEMLNDGTATAGMIAKLRACSTAREAGVSDVRIVDGRTAGFTTGTQLQ